jgi:hypothetical protein
LATANLIISFVSKVSLLSHEKPSFNPWSSQATNSSSRSTDMMFISLFRGPMTNSKIRILGRRPTYTPYFPLGCCFTSDPSRNMNSGDTRREEPMILMESHRKTQTTVIIMLLGGQSLLCSSLRTEHRPLWTTSRYSTLRFSFTCHWKPNR